MQNYVTQEVVKVNGINGVNAYQMAPNSSVLLLDTTAPMIDISSGQGKSKQDRMSSKSNLSQNLSHE